MARLGDTGLPARILAASILLPLLLCAGCRAREVSNTALEATPPADERVTSQPQILTQPRSVVMTENAPLVLSVVADGIPEPSYQWRKDGVAIPGATAATFQLPSARMSDAGTYQVEVSNEAGSVLSDRAAVVVQSATESPTVTAPPQDLVTTEGASATLQLSVGGTGPFNYVWTKDGVPGTLSNEPTLYFANLRPEDSGFYTVEVSNSAGRATATCQVTVTPVK
jgi:hypothetical protein